MKCGWCNKPDTADVVSPTAGETYGICPDCLLHHFPVIYQLIYGDITVEQASQLIVDSREPDFVKAIATQVVTLSDYEWYDELYQR